MVFSFSVIESQLIFNQLIVESKGKVNRWLNNCAKKACGFCRRLIDKKADKLLGRKTVEETAHIGGAQTFLQFRKCQRTASQ